jgi:hypothetical protein
MNDEFDQLYVKNRVFYKKKSKHPVLDPDKGSGVSFSGSGSCRLKNPDSDPES